MICICFVGVCISNEWCRLSVGSVVVICGSCEVFMLFLCIMATPWPVLGDGCVIV